MTDLLDTVAKALSDLLLQNIRIYDFRGASPYFDYQIVCHASNERQVHASIDKIQQAVPADINVKVEGKLENRWLLFDLGSILVHVMHKETREHYQIEKLFIERPLIKKEGVTSEL
ncbi:MAG: ribosome silencing factor [Candidatus Izemoplasmatales bacterium]|nr:ribosome silencing factor [Candidatus Izemoplasmatales bacterium]